MPDRKGLSPAGRSGGAYHWREYDIASLLPRDGSGKRILLLGCGDAGERSFLALRGFEAVGLDIRTKLGVDVVGDAHALPLKSSTFDVVLSMQVLEHLHSPWRAVGEVARVLRPGGTFVGSVAFLKPYHHSYFHMTHLGVKTLLDAAGLRADRFAGAQSLSYSVYGWLMPVGSLGFRRAVFGAADRFLLFLRSLIWSVSRRKSANEPTDRFQRDPPLSFRSFDRLRFAPTVVFHAKKEG